MAIQWEEQQFSILEDPADDDGRLVLMIHSIARRLNFHVLTDVFVTPSPELKTRWQEMAKRGIPVFVRAVAFGHLVEVLSRLGTPSLSLGNAWRSTIVLRDRNGWGTISVVVICLLESREPLDVDYPLSAILGEIVHDEMQALKDQTTAEDERAFRKTMASLDKPISFSVVVTPQIAAKIRGGAKRNVFILGAGASHNYPYSPFGIAPPLAQTMFKTYHRLPISGDLLVRVGDIINYVRDVKGIPPESFGGFDEDAESFMTEVDERLRTAADRISQDPSAESLARLVRLTKAYDQLVFLFAHVLNEVQNGAPCPIHRTLVDCLAGDDVIITFNWDTILDRVFLDVGVDLIDLYGIEFTWVMAGKWQKLAFPRGVRPTRFLKLHGSVNWLVRYTTRDLQTGNRVMLTGREVPGKKTLRFDMRYGVPSFGWSVSVEPANWSSVPIPPAQDPDAWPVLFMWSDGPFAAYQNRYRPGYGELAYFFPPNHPEDDVSLIPLLIPPIRVKLYDEFAHIFGPLWETAKTACNAADRITLVGYSLPESDERAIDLLKSAERKGVWPEFKVVSPHPGAVAERLVRKVGVPQDKITLFKGTFQDFMRS